MIIRVLFFSFLFCFGSTKAQIIWYEDFSLPNFTIVDTGPTAWTIDLAYDCGGSVTGYYYVFGGEFRSYDTDCDARWISEWIDVSAYASVDIYGVLDGVGGMEISGVFADSLKIGIRIDGSSTITWLDIYAGTTVQNSVSCGGAAVGADSIQIVIQERSTGGDEIHFFDDITVSVSNSLPTGGGDTIFSRGDGNWSDSTNWAFTDGGGSCACRPDSNSIVYISCGDIVDIDIQDAWAREVHVLFGGRIRWVGIAGKALNISSNGLVDVSVGAYIWENGRTDARVDFEGGGTNRLSIYGEETGLEMDRIQVNYPCSLIIEGNGRIRIEDDFEMNASDVTVINNFKSQLYILDNFEFFGSNDFFTNDSGDIYVDGLWAINGANFTFINNDTIYVDEVIDGANANDGQFTNNGYIRVNTHWRMSNNSNRFRVDNFGTVQIDDNLYESPAGANACEWHNRPGGYLVLGHDNVERDWEIWSDYDSNTVEYFRTANQLYLFTPQDAYWNLILSGSGTKRIRENLDVNGSVLISQSARLDADTLNANLTVAGNWRITSTNPIPFVFGTEQVTFDGSGRQTVNADNGAEFYNVVLNKSDTLSLASVMRINSDANMTFGNGYVSSDSINRLRIADNATVSGASDLSYVDGRIEKIGDDTFRFPVGDSGNYQPIAISSPSNAAHSFTAQYYMQNPDGYWDTNALAASIHHVSTEEFWILNRTNGGSNVTVQLFYDNNSGGVTNRDSLVVSRWNGALWADQGNGGTTGTNAAGSVISNGAVTNFSPFTLGSVISSYLSNPLPIELVSFTAKGVGEMILLNWETQSEIMTDRFVVEKLHDKSWLLLGEANAAGYSNKSLQYRLSDYNPIAGPNTYRLVEFDIDGSSEIVSYSTVKYNYVGESNLIEIYPNPVADDILNLNFKSSNKDFKEVNILIHTIDGQLVYEKGVNIESDRHALNVSYLQPGAYVISVDWPEGFSQHKFFKTKKPR